jgi:hypothetical protein
LVLTSTGGKRNEKKERRYFPSLRDEDRHLRIRIYYGAKESGHEKGPFSYIIPFVGRPCDFPAISLA